MKGSRGIYLLPNLFTTAGIFAGFYAIVSAMGARFESAAIAIIVAAVMDGLDGSIARLTNTQTDFGAQYDSLADLISFGVAPALVIYQWSLSGMGKLGWCATFVYVASTALRLARFNTQHGQGNRQVLQGLPSPAAAGLLASGIWFGEVQTYFEVVDTRIFAFPFTLIAGILMVSNIRYRKLELDILGRVPFFRVILFVSLFALIAINPPLILFLIGVLYMVSGPTMTLFWMHKYRSARNSQEHMKD